MDAELLKKVAAFIVLVAGLSMLGVQITSPGLAVDPGLYAVGLLVMVAAAIELFGYRTVSQAQEVTTQNDQDGSSGDE